MTDVCPTADFIKDKKSSSVPNILKAFIGKLAKVPIKQLSLTQATFAACPVRTAMPLQYVLAVTVDKHLISKSFNNTVHKLDFAVSYDEASFYEFLIY